MAPNRGRPLGLVLGAILVLGLSGCVFADKQVPGAAAIRRDGDSMLITICKPINAVRMTMSHRDTEYFGEWVDFLDSTGSANLDPNTPITTAKTPVGMSSTLSTNPPLNPGGTIFISIESGSSANFSSWFTIPSTGLADDRWLQPNGQETVAPC